MTAVPKPLKFLMPHYDDLTKSYGDWPTGNEKVASPFRKDLRCLAYGNRRVLLQTSCLFSE